MKRFARCIYCQKINNSRSEEHPIPISIGGKVSTTNCCKRCNNTCGYKYDCFFSNSPIYTQFTDALSIGSKAKRGIPVEHITKEGMRIQVQVSKEGLLARGRTTMSNNTLLTDDLKIVQQAVRSGKRIRSIEKRTINLAKELSLRHDLTYPSPNKDLLILAHRKVVLGILSLVFDEKKYFEISKILRDGMEDGRLHQSIDVRYNYMPRKDKLIFHTLEVSIDQGYMCFFLHLFGAFHVLFAHPQGDMYLQHEHKLHLCPNKKWYQIYEDKCLIFDSTTHGSFVRS